MGFIADEPLGDLLDEQGLDHAGKSLREQQRKAQAIDRDLPADIGYDPGTDDHITDAFSSSGIDYSEMIRQVNAQRKAIKDAMGLPPKWAKCPGNAPMTATDAKRLQDLYPYQKAGMDAMRKAYGGGAVTGRDRFTIKGKYAHLNGQELEQEFHNARAAGQGNIAEEIANEAIRRDKEKADG